MDHETNLLPQPEALSTAEDAATGLETAVEEGFPAVVAAEDAAPETPILLEPRSETAAEPMEPLQLPTRESSFLLDPEISALLGPEVSAILEADWARANGRAAAAKAPSVTAPPAKQAAPAKAASAGKPKMRKKARAKIRKPRQSTPAKRKLRLKVKRLKRSALWAERSSALCAARCC